MTTLQKKLPLYQQGDKVSFFTMPWENTEGVVEFAWWWDDIWNEGKEGWLYSVKFDTLSYSPVWEDQLKPIVG